MADIKIQSPLKRTIVGGHIATAEDIAYSVKTEGTGSLAYQTTEISIKDKIDEIGSMISDLPTDINERFNNINTKQYEFDSDIQDINNKIDELEQAIQQDPMYSEDKTIKEAIDDLNNRIEEFNTILESMDVGIPSTNNTYYQDVNEYNESKGTSLTEREFANLTQVQKIKTVGTQATGLYKISEEVQINAQEAKNYNTLAKAAAQQAADSLTSITTEKEKAIDEISGKHKEIEGNIKDALKEISSYKQIGESLIKSFNEQSSENKTFVLLNKNSYNTKFENNELDDNTVYCIYEQNDGKRYFTINAQCDTSLGRVLGSGVYEEGIRFKMLASALEGNAFNNWTHVVDGQTIEVSTNQEIEIVASCDDLYTANFYIPYVECTVLFTATNGKIQYKLNAGDEFVDTDSSMKFRSGLPITLNVVPNENYRFSKLEYNQGKNVASISSINNGGKQFIIQSDSYYNAIFTELEKYTVTVNAEEGGTANITSSSVDDKYYIGKSITLNANASEGKQFKCWTNNIDETQNTQNPLIITVDKDIQYTAVFEDSVNTIQD